MKSRQMTSQHLSESGFTDHLLGLSTAATRAHLFACEQCRQEMESFGGAIAAFNQDSLDVSRQLAATHPVDTAAIAAGKPRRSRHAGWAPGWGTGLATATALLAIAVALPLALNHSHATHISVAAISAPAEPAPAEVASDNEMMAAINAELSQPDASPLESFTSFAPRSAPTHPARHTPEKKG
jgi:hypothetical protein